MNKETGDVQKQILILTRNELLNIITDFNFENISDDTVYDILKEGVIGLENLSNKELIQEYSDYIDDSVEVLVDDYKYDNEFVSMSFTNSAGDKSKQMDIYRALALIHSTDKNLLYTHGLSYRHPTIHNKLITKEETIDIINKDSMIDIREREDSIYINTYSANDMY